MKKIKIVLAVLMALMCVAGAFAQSKGKLVVNASEGPAQVILNGKLIGLANPQFTATLTVGTYELIVRKSGLTEFRQTITLTAAGLTVNAPLGGGAVVTPPPVTPPPVVNYTLTVNGNVTGADVYVNGIQAGKTPFSSQVPAGSYTVVVKAAGYKDFTQGVAVSGNTVVTATLQAIAVPLNLGNLFPGAEIFLNGTKIGVAGTNPFITQVAPGTYTLTIRAGGFMDFSMQITVGGSGYAYTPVLQPLMANYSFQIPASIMNPEMKGNPWSQIRIFIDGVAQKDFKGQVQPGKRTIRMVSGAFQIEFIYEFVAGKTYVIEPFAGITIKE